MSVSMASLEVRAGNIMRGFCGAIGFNSAFGVVTVGRDRAGGEAGVGGTRVGAADPSDQCGVAGRARRGKKAGLVGSITLPLFQTRIAGMERLRSQELVLDYNVHVHYIV